MRFHHVALSCKDPAAIEQFYRAHFGFERARVIPLGEDQIVFLRAGEVYLELFRAENEAPALPPGGDGPHWPGVRHLAFMVDDVDATVAALGDAAQVTLGPLAFDSFIPGWKTVWLQDPEGNIIEVSQGYVDQDPPPAG